MNAAETEKWVVRDVTKSLPEKSFCTLEHARRWLAHLVQWHPNARPVIDKIFSQEDKVKMLMNEGLPITTLRSLMESHPEWADLPLTISLPNGGVEWVGGSASVYDSETCIYDEDWEKDFEKLPDDRKIKILEFVPN